ncbi:MAG: HNH endonuclease signature motif containing protein [Eubacteriales bacterium]
MNKLLSVILCLTMMLSLSATTFASTPDNTQDALATFTSDTFFYDAEKNELLNENNEPISFNDVTMEVPVEVTKTVDGISTQKIQIEIFLLNGGLKSTSNGQYTWWFNVDCPTSLFDKPNITIKAQIKGNFKDGSGSYSNVGTAETANLNSYADYGTDYTWKTTAKTGYYKISYTLTNKDMNYQTTTRTTDDFLINRTGRLWNYSFSAQDGKSLPMPRADYVKRQIYDRIPVASTYYATYKTNTGITLNSSLYDVHHIKPLAYGGSNSYSNLIHLPKSTHSGVTGWFAGY